MTCSTCGDAYENVAETDDLHIDHDETDNVKPFGLSKNDGHGRMWLDTDASGDDLAAQLRDLADQLEAADLGDALPARFDGYDTFYVGEYTDRKHIAPVNESHVTDKNATNRLTIFSDLKLEKEVGSTRGWNVDSSHTDDRGREYGYNVDTIEIVDRDEAAKILE